MELTINFPSYNYCTALLTLLSEKLTLGDILGNENFIENYIWPDVASCLDVKKGKELKENLGFLLPFIHQQLSSSHPTKRKIVVLKLSQTEIMLNFKKLTKTKI